MNRINRIILISLITIFQAQAARPVARWDVVPDQLIDNSFNAGVVAFHDKGVKVEFSINSNLVYTAENPTLNKRTDVWEFWFKLDPSKYPDGKLLIDAKAICLNNIPENPAYELPSLTLYANSGKTLGSTIVKWVDSINGDDSSAGTEAAPYNTLVKGVTSTPSGGTIYLKAGGYSSQALGGGSSRPYWTTISAAPDLDWDDVEVGNGRPSTQRLKWANLSLYTENSSEGYATILSGENGNHSVWVDNCKSYNKGGRYAASTTLFGNRYVAYVTGGLVTEVANGPGGSIIRGLKLAKITSDAWTGSGKLVVNCFTEDIDRGPTSAHPDFHQSYVVSPGWVENVILYNVKGFACKCQGLFGLRLRNSAFVNVMFEKDSGAVYNSQYSGPMENVLFMHINFFNQTWLWRGSGSSAYTATDVVVKNNIHGTMSTYEDGSIDGIDLDYNHFVSTTKTMGDNITSGDPKFADPANRDYSLQKTSPAYSTGAFLQCVPTDIDGNPYDKTARNRGPYAKSTNETGLLTYIATQQ